jgi:hypothetical protein
MIRSTLFAAVACFLSVSAFACSSTTTTTNEPTDPSDDGGSASAADPSSKAGPKCTAYIACCEDVVKSQPSYGTSCDSVKKSIDDAVASGASADAYESACAQGITAFQGAGYCK